MNHSRFASGLWRWGLLIILSIVVPIPLIAQDVTTTKNTSRRVIIIDIDGLRWDAFNGALQMGILPFFQKMLGGDEECKANAVFFDMATTIFPTVTLPGHASIFTGVYPGQHGIAGNQWFDRVGDAFKPSFINARPFDYMHPCSQLCIHATRPPLIDEMKEMALIECDSLRFNEDALLSCIDPPSGLVNKHLKAQTIYEAAGEANKSSMVIFSQYWKGVPETRVIHPNQVEKYLFGITETKFLPDPENFREYDRGMMLHALEKIRSNGFPDILTLYFSGLDATGHMLGIDSQIDYLSKFIDSHISVLLLELKRQDKNWCNNTLFVITADHGQMLINTKGEASVSAVKATLDNSGFAKNNVVAVNGGMAHIYLRNRATLNWSDSPRFDEDVILAAEALCSEMDKSKLWKILVKAPDGSYKVYKARRKRDANKCETVGTVELSEDKELKSSGLNTIELIDGLSSNRSGDILILLEPFSYFEHRELLKWGKKADHGSLHEGGLKVPIVLAGGNVKLNPEKCKEIKEENHCNDVVRTVNIARTIAGYLGFEDKLNEAKDALPVKFSE